MSRRGIPDEFALIARYFAPLARGEEGALGLADDAALLEIKAGHRLVVTNDALVAGVHFRAEDPAPLVARKLLRVSLSDLAAMGAHPLGYLLTAAFPGDTEAEWLEGFVAGLAEDQERFGLSILGGDTVATPGPMTLALTALGEVEAGAALLRSGARAGDTVYVSGTVGDGALGLAGLSGRLAGLTDEARDTLVGRYRVPEPRLALGAALVGLASAAIDVSDGLVADLGHIAECSNVGAVIEAARVPLSDAAAQALAAEPALRDLVLTGGDDYELLFTAPASRQGEVEAASRAAGVAVTAIGRMVAAGGVRAIDAEGDEIALESAGYQHF